MRRATKEAPLWIITTSGPLRYYYREKGKDHFSSLQREAERFETRKEARDRLEEVRDARRRPFHLGVSRLVPVPPNMFVEAQKAINHMDEQIARLDTTLAKLVHVVRQSNYRKVW